MKKQKSAYTVESRVNQLIIKFYDEQLVSSFGSLEQQDVLNDLSRQMIESDSPDERIRLIDDISKYSFKVVNEFDLYSKFVNHLQSIPYKSDNSLGICVSDCFYLACICHDKDASGTFFNPELEKRHYHIAVKCVTLPGTRTRQVRIGSILKMLQIVFRPAYDGSVIENHGVEVCRDFPEFLAYMTHHTKQSIEDGKYPYPDSSLFCNFPDDIRQQFLAGSTAVIGKISVKDWESLCKSAYEYGFKHLKFSQFLSDIDSYKVKRAFAANSADARMAVDAYRLGRKQHFAENRRSFHRDVILISGGHGVGKSFTSREALLSLGYSLDDIFEVGDKTAKYDDYDDEDVLIFDDNMMSQALSICDSSGITKLYKRGHNGASYIYDGHLVIVCTNLDLETFCLRARGFSCKKIDDIDNRFDRETVKALMSRFAYVHVSDFTYQASLLQYASRDIGDKLEAHKSFVDKFVSAYNTSVVMFRGDYRDRSKIAPVSDISDLPWA